MVQSIAMGYLPDIAAGRRVARLASHLAALLLAVARIDAAEFRSVADDCLEADLAGIDRRVGQHLDR